MIFLVPMILAQQPAIEETGEEDSQPANFQPSYFAPSWLVTPQELMHRIPRSAVSEMNKAEKANREHKADEEIAHLTKAVALDPDLVWARSHLASCLIPSDTQTAIAHLEEAIKVDPRQPVLFHNLAVAYLYDNQLDAAEAAARRARALGLKDLRSRVLLGWILLERRQYTIETLTLVQSGGEQYSVAYLIAARVLIEQGNLSDAVRNLRSYLSSGDTTFLPVAEEWLNFSLSTARKLMENPD
ncbi:MAG TPA: tetratricopeptide repeat protein [Bryobacteraceae bacterium]|nr:tetratricopeptide repeat protein [Bryobacteraceae bacterium]